MTGLGANIGDRAAALRTARRRVAAIPETRLVAASALFESAPVGGPPQGPFLNAALLLSTELDERTLLAHFAALEDAAGRTREVENGPRTLDLDLLVFGDSVSDDPSLTLPHPRFAERAFALAPAAEVAPHLAVPGTGGKTVFALWETRRDADAAAGIPAPRRFAEPESWE